MGHVANTGLVYLIGTVVVFCLCVFFVVNGCNNPVQGAELDGVPFPRNVKSRIGRPTLAPKRGVAAKQQTQFRGKRIIPVDQIESGVWPKTFVAMLGFKTCKHCKDIMPAVQDFNIDRRNRKNNYRIHYWDIEKHPEMIGLFGVKKGYPHFSVVVDGVIWLQHEGALKRCQIVPLFAAVNDVRDGKKKENHWKRYTFTKD